MPTVPLENLAVVGAICLLIAGIAYKRELLDKSGIAAAVGVGLIIGLLGHPAWLIVLLVYLVSSFAATKYRFQRKQEMGVAEGKRGERTWHNVVANGAPPAAVAAFAGFVPSLFPPGTAGLTYLCAIAVAASDTLASEIGVLSPKVALITHPFRPVAAGTDGGVSGLGTLAALVAALYVAGVGFLGFALLAPDTLAPNLWLLLIPVVFGFLGCQLDSLMGATLERKGWVSKGGVNFVSITMATMAGWLVLVALA